MDKIEHKPVTATGNLLNLLAVLFIGLKLTGHIAWPWIWVLAPLWIPVAVVFGVLLLIAVVTLAFGGPRLTFTAVRELF